MNSKINSYYQDLLPREIKSKQGCILAKHTHLEIVRMAVVEALENVEQPRYQTSKIELRPNYTKHMSHNLIKK